ncbi:hypothetical protein EC968_000476 [Mortierella alpina]|nr:hypothetical protein EC968_000476 [Mortierella alpina]
MLNGKDLPKETPTPVKNMDILTLLELQHPITIELHTPEQTVDKVTTSAGPSSPKQQARPSNAEELRDALFSLPFKEAQQPGYNAALRGKVQDKVQRMDVDDSPENTSDSEPDNNVDQNTSDISAESSLICEDLSDIEDNGTAG